MRYEKLTHDLKELLKENRIMTKEECREQIQEDVRTYLDEYEIPQPCIDDICQIVVDNFKKLEN